MVEFILWFIGLFSVTLFISGCLVSKYQKGTENNLRNAKFRLITGFIASACIAGAIIL